MCSQMDGYIDKAESPAEIVDVLTAWSQVLGAVIGTIPGANHTDYKKIMERCVQNAEAAFLAEIMHNRKGPKK